jgi:hypothetical protein
MERANTVDLDTDIYSDLILRLVNIDLARGKL